MSGRRLLLLAAIAAAIALWYVATGRGNQLCTVCLTYDSRTQCMTSAAGTPTDAATKARRAACYALTTSDSGRATCYASPPTSVRCRTR